MGAGLVLTGADLAPEALLPRLRELLPARRTARVSLDPQPVDEIRSVLHPEIRIGWGATGEEIVRIIYRVGPEPVIELVAIGPRHTIYEETFRLLRRK